MKSMNDIKHHLNAVVQTRQITNAMYLLSASLTRKMLDQIQYNLFYMRRIRAAVREIFENSSAAQHPYLNMRKEGRAAFYIVSSDKGLCGSFNHDICDRAMEEIKKHPSPYVESSGTRGTEILTERGIKIDRKEFSDSRRPSIYASRLIGEHLIHMYDDREINEIYFVYTKYQTQAVQKAVCIRMLPLNPDDFTDVNDEPYKKSDMIYEPSQKDVFDIMVPQYIIGYVYECLNQSVLCENIARMNAMQSSTRNADEMIKKLKFEYNTARQLAITNEITEIAAATELIKKSL